MPLVNSKGMLTEARNNRYGVLSLLGGNLEMIIGMVRAAEEKDAPLILVYNEDVTPNVPMELAMPLLVNAAERAKVPIATTLDHGRDLEQVVKAMRLGSSSVMFDGSGLPYEENVAKTKEVVRVAHAVGVDVEAELGSIAGSAVSLSDSGPEGALTDPDAAADFVEETGVDVLAISFGNTHGVYRGKPRIDLDRVRQVSAKVRTPLAMHGASGLADGEYKRIVECGISKVCYYTAMGIGASNEVSNLLSHAGEDGTLYHEIISRTIDYFCAETRKLIDLVGSAGAVSGYQFQG